MKHTLLLDYELGGAQRGYVVRALLRLEGHPPATSSRVPLNLSLVLDRSGSMAGEKLVAAREAAALLVRRLGPDDVVSVVAYDSLVRTISEPSTGRRQDGLVREIGRISPGGSTNLSGGWIRGRELVQLAQRNDAVNRVLLLTDGQANVGITDPALLCGLCQGARAGGITTSTIGFGEDYDERLLRVMADAGGGNAWYIERPDQASGVFEEEVEGLLSLAAQNVVVQVRPTAATRLTTVYNDYPSHPMFGGADVDIGDVYAREPKSLLMEFLVPRLEPGAEAAVADVTVLAYVLTAEGGMEKQTIRFPVATPLSSEGRAEPQVRRELLLLRAARARDEALQRRDRGDWEGARACVSTMAAELAAHGSALGGEIPEQAADLSAMAERLAPQVFGAADAKYMAQRSYNVRRGKGRYEEKIARPEKPR